MNLNQFLPTLLFSVLLIGCESQNLNEVSFKDQLVRKLINAEETQSSRIKGKIIILRTAYCETSDCEGYFRDYEQIQVYSREDLFMRNIRNYLEIEKIDERNGSIAIKKINGKEVEKIDIKL